MSRIVLCVVAVGVVGLAGCGSADREAAAAQVAKPAGKPKRVAASGEPRAVPQKFAPMPKAN